MFDQHHPAARQMSSSSRPLQQHPQHQPQQPHQQQQHQQHQQQQRQTQQQQQQQQQKHQHQHQQQRRRGPSPNVIRCNLCRKPVVATVYVLSCNCLLCEDCTCKHFASKTNCPTCNRTLKESDFREIVVANPQTTDQAKQSAYRRIFVKHSSESKCLHAKDIWDKIQQQSRMYREATKFALGQFLKENTFQVRRSMYIQQTLQAMKGEQTNLKQETNKQRETVESYKQQLLVARQKIEEKDRQLAQFRKMFDSRTPRSPSGSTLHGGGGRSVGSRSPNRVATKPRRVSDQGMTGNSIPSLSPPSSSSSRQYQQHQLHQQQYQRGSSHQPSQQSHRPSTPMPYQQQLHPTQTVEGGHTHPRSRNPYEQQIGGGRVIPPSKSAQQLSSQGRSQNSQNNNYSQNPYQQQAMGSFRSHSGSGSQQQQQQQAMTRSYNISSINKPNDHKPTSQSHASGSGGSVSSNSTTSSGGHIRKITATSNYSFSGTAAAAAGGPGRKRALSPSNAYAANKGVGSYTQVPRGPSNYHQQRQQQQQQSRLPGQGYNRR